MSIGFNWFKQYKIIHNEPDHWYGWYELHYLDGGSTSHSAGNIQKVQDLLEQYGDIRIPYTKRLNRDDADVPNFIEPSIVAQVCDKILSNSDVDKVDMRDRIEWFKTLSDEGYYLSYDGDW
jgi:hypothetical protein